MSDHADIVRDTLSWIHTHPDLSMDFQRQGEAALDALVAQAGEWQNQAARFAAKLESAEYDRAEAVAERDEYKQAADAEAFAADEFRARLIAAKTVMPDWTPEGWDAFIDAALAPKEDNA